MSKQATEFQRREMSRMYRGKQIFKPLNTGWIDEHVACVREWVANIFFCRNGATTIMIDAGYHDERLEEKMGWLGLRPEEIRDILITHQDTDYVGAVEADGDRALRSAKLYIGEVEAMLVPGHTWGHLVYLLDDRYLFTGDTIWLGAGGGYSFLSARAENNKLAVRSLAALERKLRSRGLQPCILTGHTGWTWDLDFAFAHEERLCSPFGKRVPDPSAPYDAYDESDDTAQRAKTGTLPPVGRQA